MKNYRLMTVLLIAVSMLCVELFEVKAIGDEQTMKASRDRFDKIEYPYKAESNRVSQITRNCNKLKKGLPKKDVIDLFGEPDLISAVYNTVKRGKVTGSSYFYLISQDVKTGSQKDKNQVGIRIHFDLDEKLIYAYGVQSPFFKDIKKTDTVNNGEEK